MTSTLKADLSVQFMHPAPALAGLVSGYHIYSAGPLGSPVWEELFFPGWANIRFTLIDGGWHCASVGEIMRPVPSIALFGPSSRGIHSRSQGGLMVGAGITPLGWHRLFNGPAYALADRIEPLAGHMACSPANLMDHARADPSPMSVKALFDQWLTTCLRPPSRSSRDIAALFARLTDTNDTALAELETALDLSASQLRRMTRYHFGFPPKLLLRRTRFLKSITRIITLPSSNWSTAIESSYYDYAHFVRDCQEFLGMSPREFLALDRPMTHLSLAMRAKQLGAPLQGIHKAHLDDPPLPDEGK